VRCGSFPWAAASTSGPFGSAKRPWSGATPPTQIPANANPSKENRPRFRGSPIAVICPGLTGQSGNSRPVFTGSPGRTG
jgi:hypothetical protein